ncbi:two-component sensor histidine kinase [Actinomyces naeslundii]|uniref:sensor histidine kinase n=1 Tax=Actinomyces naeslundii TaxID=1655 RepID=UPI00096D5C13|nr:HAMP domain-containing sensor histidine kinase [Actinomyces naeslundii]OMG13061.1 two-component sensor histidine kinase [Actinomyces naeslundii]
MAAARGGSTRPAKSSGKQHRPIKRGRWHPITAIQRPWQAMPLRTRLTLMTTGLLAIGLIVVSFVVTSLLYSHMMGQIDSQLRTTSVAIGSQGLAQIREGGTSSTTFPSNYYVKAEYFDPSRNGEWISADTAATYGRPQVKGLDYQRALAHTAKGDYPITTVNSDQPGHQWRMITLLIKDQNTGQYTGAVALALPLSDVMETVERTRLVVALADVSIISVGAVFATYLVHRSFRSLRQIEGVAGRIAHGDLSARILVTEPRTTEVGSLQRAINAMLAQNETSFAAQVVAQERMTRFVSDASHELRTPLAAIRGYGELYRMGGVPANKTGEVMGRIETESNRMGRLVDDLLQLARIDEGREMSMEPVNLTDLAAGALSDMMVLAPERDCGLIPLDPRDEAAGIEAPSLQVIGDRDRLSQILTNLLGNVVRHTPSGTPVEIAIGMAPPRTNPTAQPVIVVEVRDHGHGVPPEAAEKVFQRFYRSDTSRNRETGGSGLGLAIVLGIVAAHKGTVQMLQTPGGGATVHIELPPAPAW